MTDEKQKNAFLRKIANAEDEATGDAFEVFKFNKPLGATARIRVRRADARNPTKLMETLLSSNWDAPAADDQAKAMVRAAIEAEPQKHWLFAAHVGFRDELSNFIFPDGVVGENTGPRVLKPPLWAEATMQLSRRGSLEEWIQKVAQPCKFSSRLMLLVSCGFAAPILPVAGLQPFAVLVYGKPKSGKTTAILVAASIIGIGAESRLLNFNMTDAALLERARFLNNQCVPVNETGALKGDKKYAYPKLRTTIYTFAEGQDTLRHSGSSYATPASSSTWAGILLANSENSLDELAGLTGSSRDGGEYARCIEVAALSGSNATVFDLRPANIERQQFPEWSRRALIRLRQACAENHGKAMVAYVKFVTANRQRVLESVPRYMNEFLTALNFKRDDGALLHAAQNAAAIYAGGRLGIDAGILPWKDTKLLKAIMRCFNDFVRTVKTQETLRQGAIKILQQHVKALKRKGPAGISPAKHDGFKEDEGDEMTFTVKVAAMRRWFPDQLHFRAALDWLDDTGRLIKARANTTKATNSIDWAITTPRWQGEHKAKSIRFRAKPKNSG